MDSPDRYHGDIKLWERTIINLKCYFKNHGN